MIRFRNPGTQYNTQVQVFKELYKKYKDAPNFDLDDMATTIAETRLMTSYGYAGATALALSNTEDDSRNSTKMNAKMYAEVFRLLGWTTSVGRKSYPLMFTYIGEHVACDNDVLPLYEQCVLGINNPQEVIKVKYIEKVRFFKTVLFFLEDLNGVMYKHELCLGPMQIDDLDDKQYAKKIDYLKSLRGSYQRYQEAYDQLCYELGVKKNLPDNSTRLPIAFMKTCRWVEDKRTASLYPPKTLQCIQITEHGRYTAKILHNMKDLRLDEYYKFPDNIQRALIRIGIYSMLFRAGYDITPVKEILNQDKAICANVLEGKELLFSPYQTLHHSVVDEALGIIHTNYNKNKGSQILEHLNRSKMISKNISLSGSDSNYNTIKDINISTFTQKVLSLKKSGVSKQSIIDRTFNEKITETQKEFYPFVGMLFRIMGMDCQVSRPGDNGARWDAIIIDKKQSIPIEIKSPTEEQHLSLKAIRQALENKIILLSRKTYPTQIKTTSLAIGYYLPNDRAEVAKLIEDFKYSYGYNIGIIDLKTLLKLAITVIYDHKKINIDDLNELEGFANATFD